MRQDSPICLWNQQKATIETDNEKNIEHRKNMYVQYSEKNTMNIAIRAPTQQEQCIATWLISSVAYDMI